MYHVVVPNFKPCLPYTRTMLVDRDLIMTSKIANIKLSTEEPEMRWVLYGLIMRMIKEDYYDIVYKGIKWHYQNEFNWGKPSKDWKYF